jgi:hypothetical protein
MLLGGCFESATPLIAATNADYPFEQPFHYMFYEWNKDAKNWEPSETGTISRDGDHYVQLADLGNSDKGDPFLLKSIGDNYYIAQQPNNSSFIYVRSARRIISTNMGWRAPTGTRVRRTGPARFIHRRSTAGSICVVSSLRKGRLFRAIAAERPQPQGMFGR